MTFDFSTIIFLLFAVMALQPFLTGRWFAVRRAQAIKAIEKKRRSRVITMIHRQEKRSLLGMSVSRHIDLEDAQTIIAAIKETPGDKPIDPQIFGFPAASIVRARDDNPPGSAFDLTLVLADIGEKALAQVKRGAIELLLPKIGKAKAERLSEKLAGGHWTHDYGLTAGEASEIGLGVNVGMPIEVLDLMKLYPQPLQSSAVEYLPIDLPHKKKG